MNLENHSQSHQVFLAAKKWVSLEVVSFLFWPPFRHVDVDASFDDAAVHDPTLGAWPGV